jgi:hypothetical protein
LARAAAAALRAPSVFNTQPWRWRVAVDTAQLFADRSRQVATVDPRGRLLTVSCGAALHHALVALAASGYQTRVRCCPDPARPDLLAEVRIVGEMEPDPAAVSLLHSVTVRHTDRRPFAATPVSDAVLVRLRCAAQRHGAYLHVLRPEQVVVLAAASARAAEVELNDPAYRDELVRWAHRPGSAGDGVPPGTAGPVRGRRVPLRQFHLDEIAAGLSTPDPVDAAAVYAILFTDADDTVAWLAAGQALSEVLLAAAGAGVAASPMSDVVEVGTTRHALRTLISGIGHPMLVLRLGVPRPGAPVDPTPRRTGTEVVDLRG